MKWEEFKSFKQETADPELQLKQLISLLIDRLLIGIFFLQID